MNTSSKSAVLPVNAVKRSPLYRRHSQKSAQFLENNGGTVVDYYTSVEAESAAVRSMALVDLTTLPRIGYKGKGAPSWLQAQGLTLPEKPNRVQRQASGSALCSLSKEEHLLLADLPAASTDIEPLQRNWSLDEAPQTYQLPRGDSHCWFAICGSHSAEMMAKVCGVDLRAEQFSQGDIAQTSVAKVSAIVIRQDLGSTPCFYVMSDMSSAEYLWDCLDDAMQEFDGQWAGISALLS